MQINIYNKKCTIIKVLLNALVCFICISNSAAFANKPDYIEDSEKGMRAYRNGNLIEAMKLLEKSASQGYAPAQTTLAYILDQAEENKRAFNLFKQAAEKNYAAAQFGLGNMYAKGEGTEKNIKLAGQWIQKSAQQNYTPAMRAYAYALEFGNLSFTKNDTQSFQWYEKCSQSGDPVCTRRLVQVYTRGDLNQAMNKDKADQLQLLLNPPLKDKN